MIFDLITGEGQQTFASRLAMNGVDVSTLMKLLGHKIIVIKRRYSHLSDEYRKIAVEKLVNHDSYQPRFFSNSLYQSMKFPRYKMLQHDRVDYHLQR